MAVSRDGSDADDGVYVYTGSLHERRVPGGVAKVVCRGDVKVIRSAAFDEVSSTEHVVRCHLSRRRILTRRRLIRPRRT